MTLEGLLTCPTGSPSPILGCFESDAGVLYFPFTNRVYGQATGKAMRVLHRTCCRLADWHSYRSPERWIRVTAPFCAMVFVVIAIHSARPEASNDDDWALQSQFYQAIARAVRKPIAAK